MNEHFLIGLAGIVTLGTLAQWLAWRFRLPSILLLLIFGFLAGPVTGWLNPDLLFGELLFPVVSIAVAIILFEGGMNLKLSEFQKIGGIVWGLVTIGALLTWLFTTIAAIYLLELPWQIALLLGSVLVVTGPTVIMPMLRHIQLKGMLGSIIKWEGITIDPVGAVLAVLVFEALVLGTLEQIAWLTAFGLLKTLLIGTLLGFAGAGFLILFFKNYWVPDFLQNAVVLMTVIATFTLSNLFQHESGLLTVTLMGIILVNQKWVSMKHIIEFKENLQVLLISSLFILLAARVRLEHFQVLGMESILFLGVLIVIIRPVSTFLAVSRQSSLNWKERGFLACLAPRGIVAAAVASIFAIRLERVGYQQADQLVPLTFLVIMGTVTVYGLTAPWIARWLQLSDSQPEGVLFVGAHPMIREIAKCLQEEQFTVLLIDSNWDNISGARMAGLPAYYGSALSEGSSEQLDLSGIGRLVAMTSNSDVNALACLHFLEVFGREEIYQLAPFHPQKTRQGEVPLHLRGRILFGEKIIYHDLINLFNAGAIIKKTPLTEDFDYAAFQKFYEIAIPLFMIDKNGHLTIFSADSSPIQDSSVTLISLVSQTG
ncbi:MAG: sodium:proton antiporter [SAR324 cluster bacterium]|nr:sodium:proton antiporter [SAR324 cluster bacterium]